MKFLVDQNLSPKFVDELRRHGHDAVRTSELGLAEASDDVILDVANRDRPHRCVIRH